MTFERLTPGDWIAWVAALVLIVSMSFDWWSSTLGDEARRIEERAEPSGALGGEAERRVQEDARIVAEQEEKNAFQADALIDRLILLVLLGAAAAAFAAGVMRAAERRVGPPSPSAVASILAVTGAVLIAYRIFQEPGFDEATTVKFGALLGLISCAALGIGARAAVTAEREGTAWGTDEKEEQPA